MEDKENIIRLFYSDILENIDIAFLRLLSFGWSIEKALLFYCENSYITVEVVMSEFSGIEDSHRTKINLPIIHGTFTLHDVHDEKVRNSFAEIIPFKFGPQIRQALSIPFTKTN
jgi:hypothetical protein